MTPAGHQLCALPGLVGDARGRAREEERPQCTEETGNRPRPKEERKNEIDAPRKRHNVSQSQSEADQRHQQPANDLHPNRKLTRPFKVHVRSLAPGAPTSGVLSGIVGPGDRLIEPETHRAEVDLERHAWCAEIHREVLVVAEGFVLREPAPAKRGAR